MLAVILAEKSFLENHQISRQMYGWGWHTHPFYSADVTSNIMNLSRITKFKALFIVLVFIFLINYWFKFLSAIFGERNVSFFCPQSFWALPAQVKKSIPYPILKTNQIWVQCSPISGLVIPFLQLFGRLAWEDTLWIQLKPRILFSRVTDHDL